MVELLVVMAIMAILIAMVAPAMKGTMRAYSLTSTGQTVIGQLAMARQTALATNHAVQVRFYELPDYNAAATATPTVFRGMQCFTETDTESFSSGAPSAPTVTVTPITRPTFFPTPVIGLNNVTSSPLLSLTPVSTLAATDPSLPTYGNNYRYIAIRFQAGGGAQMVTGASANVSAISSTNIITFIVENDATVANGLPANYLTLTIDPVTGTIQSYRP
jgi:uncharacterized protein (TIGR02596 family)